MRKEIVSKKDLDKFCTFVDEQSNQEVPIPVFDLYFGHEDFSFNCGCEEVSAEDVCREAVEVASRNKLNPVLCLAYLLVNMDAKIGTIVLTTIKTQTKEIKLLTDFHKYFLTPSPFRLFPNPRHNGNISTMWLIDNNDLRKFWIDCDVNIIS